MTLFEMNLHAAQNEMLYTGKASLEREDLETLLKEHQSLGGYETLHYEALSATGDIIQECEYIPKLVKKGKDKIGDVVKAIEKLADENELDDIEIAEISRLLESATKQFDKISESVEVIEEKSYELRDAANNIGQSE